MDRLTDKNRRGAFIEYFGRTKWEDTKAERGFAAIVRLMGGIFDKARPVRIRLTSELKEPAWVELTPDGWVRLPDYPQFYGYADGPHHWTDTERRKDKRFREALGRAGLPSVGVDSPLLESGDFVADVIKDLTVIAAALKVSGGSWASQVYA